MHRCIKWLGQGWVVCTITVLSIGERDRRIRINLCLTARAFGADKAIFIGKKDASIARHMSAVNEKWGGDFKVEFAPNVAGVIKPLTKYKKVYLTMYGMPLRQVAYTLKTYKNILLIITQKEHDTALSGMADYSVSITTQPHAQVTSVAVFLHEFFSGRELAVQFPNAKYKVVPDQKGMIVKGPD
ncbi:MAG: tRNA (cytidine(56)-2'-O)-methyltransferase [Candidatus Micrarchaeaceae archaeon]